MSGPQQVAIRYTDLANLDGFAWDWGKANDRVLMSSDRLVGFCLLIRRELVDKIGLLDERFGIGCFEDDDYCLRATRAGYRSVIARDAFVHHFGGRTFIGSGVDFGALMQQNQQLFRAKWQDTPEPSTPQVAPAVAEDGTQLSLCMIVRDNARTIEAALESIRPWVDEMVVVDTGSTDETPQIAERLGARVFHFPWCDDFSAARNESLRHARGAWIFWMDSDDTIDAANGRKLRETIRHAHGPSDMGFYMQVHCPGRGADGEVSATVVDHVKLFRNLPELRFEGRIHEQILLPIRRLGGQVAWTDIFVVHSGSDQSPEGRARKHERDMRLLELEYREQPNHPFTLFNLGMTHSDAGWHEQAADFLLRSIANSGPDESHLRKAYALLVHCYRQMGRREVAWETCREGLQLFPADAELRFRAGTLLHELGRLPEAAQAFQSALQNEGERHLDSIDQGIRGYRTRQNLAVVYRDMGELAKSEDEWRLVIQELPRYRPGWRGLGEILLLRGKLEEAMAVADQLQADSDLRSEAVMLRSQLAMHRGDMAVARQELEQAVRDYPDDLEPLRALCQFLFEHAEPVDARAALAELVRRDPQDASAHHNLGMVYHRMREFPKAVEAYQQSLRLRADSAAAHLHLGYASKEAGRLDEAVAAWREVLRLAPGDPAATEALRQAGESLPI